MKPKGIICIVCSMFILVCSCVIPTVIMYPKLPDIINVHFAIDGSKLNLMLFCVLFSVLFPTVMSTLVFLIRFCPIQVVNLPYKEYFAQGTRFKDLIDDLFVSFLEFGTVFGVYMMYVQSITFAQNMMKNPGYFIVITVWVGLIKTYGQHQPFWWDDDADDTSSDEDDLVMSFNYLEYRRDKFDEADTHTNGRSLVHALDSKREEIAELVWRYKMEKKNESSETPRLLSVLLDTVVLCCINGLTNTQIVFSWFDTHHGTLVSCLSDYRLRSLQMNTMKFYYRLFEHSPSLVWDVLRAGFASRMTKMNVEEEHDQTRQGMSRLGYNLMTFSLGGWDTAEGQGMMEAMEGEGWGDIVLSVSESWDGVGRIQNGKLFANEEFMANQLDEL
ncbi:hypothetical protein BLNAU_9016 [Blattamonas nauphoetae]|uniref:DUF1648 domain-containing protein n=1 Tax=Blattamonas nauphoetae TaxID=2049346 RepID=A0ABQ9XX32_9EUKA|nr:hypothetical protein BLNAU_9016 [Blattamonas nauphoetae]